MQEDAKRFRVVKFRFKTDNGTYMERNMVVDNHIPLFHINQWIDSKSIRKASTGSEYAVKLTVFLNWLDRYDISYENATNRHVNLFLHSLIYGNMENEKVKSIETTVGISTLNKYIAVITGFYKWIDDNYETAMSFKEKTNTFRARKSFMYVGGLPFGQRGEQPLVKD